MSKLQVHQKLASNEVYVEWDKRLRSYIANVNGKYREVNNSYKDKDGRLVVEASGQRYWGVVR